MMNKQEVIEKIENIGTLKINDTVLHQQFDMIDKYKVLGVISKINEPKKVMVPKFVADYIEYCKHEKFYALHGAYANMGDRLTFWGFKGNNSELFAKAWLYGYEVEHEQHYVVAIPDDERNKFIQLWRSKDGKLLFNFQDKIRYGEVHLLTEQEIKQKDERLWQFAEEVEDE